MSLVYECDKCGTYTDNRIVLCPSYATMNSEYSTTTQDKISAIVREFDAAGSERYSSQNFDQVIERMRQLSTSWR